MPVRDWPSPPRKEPAPSYCGFVRLYGFTFRTAKIGRPLETPRMSPATNEAASYCVRDGIAVITLDNPPVNGLGNALRAGIMEKLKQADADAAVKAAILIGSAKAFSGGADIREFNQTRAKPDLFEVNDRQDAMSKPLVAAIGGFALG